MASATKIEGTPYVPAVEAVEGKIVLSMTPAEAFAVQTLLAHCTSTATYPVFSALQRAGVDYAQWPDSRRGQDYTEFSLEGFDKYEDN